MTTRRKFVKIAGASAATSVLPRIGMAQDAGLVADRESALDHLVVVMFENRSFDNLLGRLYAPDEVKSFAGVIGRDFKNPIPEWAEHGAERRFVPYGIAPNMNTPHPDPGEEYPHLNTDLFGILNSENRSSRSQRWWRPTTPPTIRGCGRRWMGS
jgi:Phospholipase C